MDTRERIKDLSKVKLEKDHLLIEVVKESKTLIIKPGEEDVEFDYLKVVTVGSNVENYKVGDYVLDAALGNVAAFKHKGKTYIYLLKHAIKLAVEPDNYEKEVKLLN
jgi:hypothetical protein